MGVVKLKDFKREVKKREFKEAAKEKLNSAVDWIERNKEVLAIAIPIGAAGITGAGKLIRGHQRKANLKKEQELKELYCYDRSLGHYWELKRPLSNEDWVQINEHRSNGESLGDILESLKVLK